MFCVFLLGQFVCFVVSFCIFGVFSPVCFELSVPVQVIVCKDSFFGSSVGAGNCVFGVFSSVCFVLLLVSTSASDCL